MNINPEIEKKLTEAGIPVGTGVVHLLILYHELSIPLDLHVLSAQINQTGIIDRDYETPGRIKWLVPLYEGVEPIDEAWEWVNTEYRQKFADYRASAKGDKAGCMKKMKKFFSENPQVRKEEVIKAAEFYLSECRRNNTNPTYIQRADYFISKVVEGTKNSRLEMYLELLKDSSKSQDSAAVRNLNRLL